MDDEDRRLVESARDGNAGAGPFLVSKHAPRLLGRARRFARDRSCGMSDTDIELAVGLGIENALRKIATYDSERSPLEAWFWTHVKYAVLEWSRSNTRTLTIDPTLKDGPLGTETVAARDEAAPTSDRLGPAIAALHDAIPKLSHDDQKILALRNQESYSFATIAELLSIKETTCRQRHKRAKDRLQKLLQTDPRTETLTGEDT
jgi:RNA polymerase sigma factor (sigma-70 family)